ncbi:MAG: hypothetical protein JSS40_01150 [Proteobacteria bacterium]|nr:hypothetical protein [Pseudomonadota bacterium]
MRLQRRLLTLFLAGLLLGGCAILEPRPAPLTRGEVVLLAKSGEPPSAIIERLRQTQTVLPLSASDILQLAQDGVPREVLDYLQAAQIEDLRRRMQFERMLYGPEMSPFSRCAGYGPGLFNCAGPPFWPR